MELKKAAMAGTVESSDAQITVEPGTNGIELNIESSVIQQYGRQIKAVVLETLKKLDVKNAKVSVVDKGALDCTLKARVEGAVSAPSMMIRIRRILGRSYNMAVINTNPNFKRLRRSMMFLNAQKPSLIKDPYVYKPDSIMLDLEDAVAENQKDAARYSLFHALKEIDYHGCERVVRINGLETPHWKEDIRVCVAGGADTIRISKTESAQDVKLVEEAITAAEKEFHKEVGSTLIMAAIESTKGILNVYDICQASDRLFGVALSGGDYTRDLQTSISKTGVELMGARQQMVIAARATGRMCFDTVYTDLDDMEGFRKDVEMIKTMGFDGKSIINPRQIPVCHEVFTPNEKQIRWAEAVVREIDTKKAMGIGVFTLNGKMLDVAFYDGAKRTIALAKAAGVYKGDL